MDCMNTVFENALQKMLCKPSVEEDTVLCFPILLIPHSGTLGLKFPVCETHMQISM